MSDELVERLRAATELLEAVVADRSLLETLPLEARTRLLNAAGDVYEPDVQVRRRQIKAQRRQMKQDRAQRDQAALDETGIRSLRARPVFTTPNVALPPSDVGPDQIDDGVDDDSDRGDADGRETLLPLHCYVCKRKYTTIHPFYDQMCTECGDLNYAKRSETADLSGRVALLTGGRVKIGYQAGIKLLRAGAHLIVTTRFPRDSAVRYAAEARLRRLGASARDLRTRPAPHAECRGVLPAPARHP